MRKETLFFVRAVMFHITWTAMGLFAVLFLTKAWQKSRPRPSLATQSLMRQSHEASAARVR